MKKIMLFVLALCLCFTAFGAAFAETAATEAPSAEKPAAEMTAEELLYRRGKEVEQDLVKAAEYFQKALELRADAPEILQAVDELAAALYEDGKAAMNAGDYEKAMEYCRLAADFGYSEAIKEIGNLYCYGLGVEPDDDKAFE